MTIRTHIGIAHSAYHPYLHASFKENIVPTPNAFNGDFYGGIVKGPDGATWFTERVTNKIGRLDSSGHFREYTLPTSSARPEGITVGPDRALWFAEQAVGKIGRIDVHGVINEFSAGLAIPDPFAIVKGPDGALWYASFVHNFIGRITMSGFATPFPYTPTSLGGACGITVGPDHNIYFTQTNGKIRRMSVSGSYAQINTPTGSDNMSIVTEPDRNLWFTDYGNNAIGRLNPTTDFITEFPIPTPNSSPDGITNLDDGTLAFTEFNAGQIGRVGRRGNIKEYMILTFNSDYYYPTIPHETAHCISVQPFALRQVLYNLLINAFKYSPVGSKVTVSARISEMTTNLSYAPALAEVSIKDAGYGIPPEEQSLLFAPFVRLKRDISGHVRGSGLGLYICKQLIEGMGGVSG